MQQQNKMGIAPMGRLLLGMSIPSIFSMLIQALYNIVDSIFVSQISEDALTAVSLAFPIQTLMIAVGVGTGVGINSLISRRLGEKRVEEANQTAAHGMVLAVINWAVFALVGLFAVAPFFQMATNGDPAMQSIRSLGVDYTRIVTIFSLGVFVQISIERIFQSTGNMMIPMLIQLTGAVINLILDPIMIFGYFGFPPMGVAGAAAATVIGQIIGMLLGLIFLFCIKFDVRVRFRGFRFQKGILRDIYAVGLPAIIMQSIMAVLTVALNGILIAFSSAAVSVLGVYYKLQSFVFMPVFGLTQGAMPIMGYNFGAGSKKRLLHCLRLTTVAAVAIMALGTAVFMIWPRELLLLFTATDNMLVIGVPALRTISVCFAFAGVGIVISTIFQAIGHGMKSLLISLLRQLVVILPLAWLFARYAGLEAVWLAFPISEMVAFIACLVLFYHSYRSEIKGLVPFEEGRPECSAS